MGARERMFGGAVAVLLVVSLAACGSDGSGDGGIPQVSFDQLTEDPSSYSGDRVRVVGAFWVGSFEQSVLTGALAESYPPQPVEPLVWVATGAEGDCITTDEGVSWGPVVAQGRFRHDDGGGFGHLGVYTMELDDAALRCR